MSAKTCMMQNLHDTTVWLSLIFSHGGVANGPWHMTRRRIGVLGGMGPLATVDFMRKVIEGTPATCDQDHVPMIVYSVPQVPDRVSAILQGRDDPFEYLRVGVQTLERAGEIGRAHV